MSDGRLSGAPLRFHLVLSHFAPYPLSLCPSPLRTLSLAVATFLPRLPTPPSRSPPSAAPRRRQPNYLDVSCLTTHPRTPAYQIPQETTEGMRRRNEGIRVVDLEPCGLEVKVCGPSHAHLLLSTRVSVHSLTSCRQNSMASSYEHRTRTLLCWHRSQRGVDPSPSSPSPPSPISTPIRPRLVPHALPLPRPPLFPHLT